TAADAQRRRARGGAPMTTELALTERLRPALQRARNLAVERVAPVLVSVACPTDDFDAVGVFARAASNDRALWLQPDRGVALVGVGSTARIDAAGPRRFAQAAATWRACTSGAVVDAGDAPLDLPLALGGFAFRPAGEATAVLPDAHFALPRLLF